MLSSSHLFLSSPSSLDDTNNTDGGDKEVARAPDDIKTVPPTVPSPSLSTVSHDSVSLILMRMDILDNRSPLEEAISEDVPTPLLSMHRSTVSRPVGITSEHSSSEDVPAQPAQLADGPIDGHLHLLTSRCTVRPQSDVSEQWDLMRRKTPTRMRPRMFLHDNGRAPFPPSTSSSRADSAAIDRGFQTSDWTHRLPHIRHTDDGHNDQHGYDVVLDTDPSVAKLTPAGG
ncbi:hypothetical protein EDB85DRAFT_2155469 [Lactarius pseudohatsudake]|nr:hypothetical protein EDB85DRAFT_2155469 [Lactarius pseudohatsudake]